MWFSRLFQTCQSNKLPNALSLFLFFPVYSRQITNWADFKSAYNSTVNWVTVHFTSSLYACVQTSMYLCGAVQFDARLSTSRKNHQQRTLSIAQIHAHINISSHIRTWFLPRSLVTRIHSLQKQPNEPLDFSVHFLKQSKTGWFAFETFHYWTNWFSLRNFRSIWNSFSTFASLFDLIRFDATLIWMCVDHNSFTPIQCVPFECFNFRLSKIYYH